MTNRGASEEEKIKIKNLHVVVRRIIFFSKKK